MKLKRGEKPQAPSALQSAARHAPNSPSIQYHLAEAYYENEQHNLSMATLDQLLAYSIELAEQENISDLQSRLSKLDSAKKDA